GLFASRPASRVLPSDCSSHIASASWTDCSPLRQPGLRNSVTTVDAAQARRFGALLRKWFRANGRDLPWRKTRDPYHVLVSELMLQQTQVSRVVPRYAEFLDTFPTLHDVARARPTR